MNMTVRGNESWSFSAGAAVTGDTTAGKLQVRWAS